MKGRSKLFCYHTIKPFDIDTLVNSLTKTGHVITVEELSSHDGIFNQVMKSSIHLGNIKYSQIAIDDFVYGYGSYKDLCLRLGLSAQGILRKSKYELSSFVQIKLIINHGKTSYYFNF